MSYENGSKISNSNLMQIVKGRGYKCPGEMKIKGGRKEFNKDEYVHKMQTCYWQTDGPNSYRMYDYWLEESSSKFYTSILNRNRENYVFHKKNSDRQADGHLKLKSSYAAKNW